FYIRENFQPLRAEYDAYCRWAAERVRGLRWGREVVDVRREDQGREGPGDDDEAPVYRVTALTREGTETYRARHLVLGIGTTPWSPIDTGLLDGGGTVALHASDYLHRREDLLSLGSVTVVGSGQSAAEIYNDLLSAAAGVGPRVDWVTRSPRFFPMEYTKLTLEMTSPEYIDHFHELPPDQRDRMLREQRSLYKGIDAELINQIHDLLYRRSVQGLDTGLLAAATALDRARREAGPATATATATASALRLDLHCTDTGRKWTHHTEGLVLATGYSPTPPRFLDGIAEEIDRDGRGRYRVARDHTVDRAHSFIHVQNAEEHTHGLTAPDLGMGAMRNSIILRGICGREVYPIESSIAFQQFGAPTARHQEAR
ncbi:MAG TPA: L-lysine 6-monooxygenase, partial [Dietzia sp.]|nr:L-lysine 6-monooxygenase [Dietzia sp.]